MLLALLGLVSAVRHSFLPRPLDLPTCSNIDVVFTWVNGTGALEGDLLHARTVHRYRNMDELRYALRSVKKNMPYVRKVFIVTSGERVSWLLPSDFVEYVRHEDIMPIRTLPTYNSLAIESYLHKIPGLSEFFVYLNDDCLITSPLHPRLLFDGPVDTSTGCYLLDPNRKYVSLFPVERRKAPNLLGRLSRQPVCGHYHAIANSNAIVSLLIGRASQPHYPSHTLFAFRRSVLQALEPILQVNGWFPYRSEHSISVANTEGYLAVANHFEQWQKREFIDDAKLFSYVPLEDENSLLLLTNELNRNPISICINDVLASKYNEPLVLGSFVTSLHAILETAFPEPAEWEQIIMKGDDVNLGSLRKRLSAYIPAHELIPNVLLDGPPRRKAPVRPDTAHRRVSQPNSSNKSGITRARPNSSVDTRVPAVTELPLAETREILEANLGALVQNIDTARQSKREDTATLLRAAMGRYESSRYGVQRLDPKTLPPLGPDRKLILVMDNIERARGHEASCPNSAENRNKKETGDVS
ncbi:SacB [Giardia muris]|uniref:SacB n=1 Tax=Giardia muris TaxID=5742 RepID=A0A4Z1T011_GIAMU|nr:SacB [Giardia muris]|eukprot:TNJ26247.1 SacB [Giardia muris]